MRKDSGTAKKALQLGLAALVLGLSACASGIRDRAKTAPLPDDFPAKIAEASGLVRRGHYVAFKRAAAIYKDLYARPSRKKDAASPYVRALILLRVRESQIGILFSPTAAAARSVAAENPSLKDFLPAIELADQISPPRSSRGIQTDINMVNVTRQAVDSAKFRADLKTLAPTDELYAFLYVSFAGSMGGFSREAEDLSRFYALFPDSPLMKLANATRYLKEKPEILIELAAEDPEFYEAYFFLGELSLAERSLMAAEANFLKALPGLDDSPQEQIYLASIYTATEEFEKSLERYDKTLALSPEFRDALLGKAICLSYLGRTPEAIETLDRMVALGSWLMGEAHYWLAWNYHSLKDEETAQAHIEESKGRLPTNSEVFGLAGSIALEKNEIDRAEKEFVEALRYNGSNTEALFGMGRVNDIRKKWPAAAGWYETASKVLGEAETAVAGKIAEIKAAPLPEDRRGRLLAKKEAQLKVIRATRATACFDIAVDWVNGGRRDLARPWAEKAAAHPQFKDKAAALLAKIKG